MNGTTWRSRPAAPPAATRPGIAARAPGTAVSTSAPKSTRRNATSPGAEVVDGDVGEQERRAPGEGDGGAAPVERSERASAGSERARVVDALTAWTLRTARAGNRQRRRARACASPTLGRPRAGAVPIAVAARRALGGQALTVRLLGDTPPMTRRADGAACHGAPAGTEQCACPDSARHAGRAAEPPPAARPERTTPAARPWPAADLHLRARHQLQHVRGRRPVLKNDGHEPANDRGRRPSSCTGIGTTWLPTTTPRSTFTS